MSADEPLHLSAKERSYLNYLKEGGLVINLPAEKDLEHLSVIPPWMVEGQTLMDETDEDLDYEDMDTDFLMYHISRNLIDAVAMAMHRGDWAVSMMEAMQVNEQRNALHAARLIVKAVQAKLKDKLAALQLNDHAKESNRQSIKAIEVILNEVNKEFMDLSKVFHVEDGKIRQKTVAIL